jgi:hypothetical protein
MSAPLYLFYEEPDPDRWLPLDRYPRKFIRRIVRGPSKPGGVMRWFLNLKSGLDQLGVDFRVNDYRGLKRHSGSLACVVGKPHVIEKIPPGHPILYGPGVSAHPFDNDFWDREDIQMILLSCDWFKAMYDRDLPREIPTRVWPAGVETDLWRPPAKRPEDGPVLIYDKIRWERESYLPELLEPIRAHLDQEGIPYRELRYGYYEEEDFRELVRSARAMIFLCEHETQGFAYLQALASGAPIYAWDRGGEWKDPAHFPHSVRFGPVTSVPYFDHRCGARFADLDAFYSGWDDFWHRACRREYQPRDYIVSHFNLKDRARAYLNIAAELL